MEITWLLIKLRELARASAGDERGAIAMEYVLLGLVVAIGIIAGLVIFREAIVQAFQNLAQRVLSS